MVDDHTVTTAANQTNTNNVDITTSVNQDSGTDYTASWTLIAGDKIKLTAGTKTVTIDCTAKYTLGTKDTESSKGVITLTDNSGKGETTTKAYIGGSNGISVTSDANGVTINGKTLDDASIIKSNMSVSDTGAMATTLKTKGGADITGTTITPQIQLGDNTNSKYSFLSGTATLPVYTKTEVDNKFKDLDAVHYKGTVNSYAAFKNLTDLRVGDAYKVASADIKYRDSASLAEAQWKSTKIGDLLIANGTEGEDGYITANTLYWDYIPSGDDT